MNEPDELDLFLQTWEPSERLQHASIPQYLGDPFAYKRLLDDSTGSAGAERALFEAGRKRMASDELLARAYEFFQARHVKWSTEFRDYVLSKEVPEWKFDTYATSFAHLWVDGKTRRQDSQPMLAIKASIRDFDRERHPTQAGRFVINHVDDNVAPLFTPDEMAVIFEANDGLLDAFLADYVDELGNKGPGSVSGLYVRRGVRMPTIGEIRLELHYLSSYSLALGPVEQFALTWAPSTKDTGVPSIFSAPLAAIQRRVVAFAPFIQGMMLDQLELVIAPPVEPTLLQNDGEWRGIHEFSFL